MSHAIQSPSQKSMIAAIIRRAPMFASLEPSEIDDLAGVFFPCILSQGQYLFRQGDLGNFMALLSSGTLGVKIAQEPSRSYDNALEPFEIIGEMTCLDPAPRSASVVALSNSEVLILERASVDYLREHSPRTYSALLRCIWQRVSTRLRVTNEAISLYSEANGEATFHRSGEVPPRPHSFRGDIAVEALEQVSLFSRREIEILCSVARKTFYPDGSFICREGEPPHACYILVRGCATVYRDTGRHRHVLGTLHEGALFGQVALLEHRRRSATVVASGDTVVVELNRGDFDKLINSSTPFALRFQEMVTINGIRQLRSANQRYAA